MRRLMLAILLTLGLPVHGWAAVSFTSDIEAATANGVDTTLTLASVPGTTGDIIVAFFSWRKGSTQTVTGVTYGGAAMTQICTDQASGGGAMSGWYYTGATSTQDVVATFSLAPANMQGSASVIAGADISGTPLGTATCNANASATAASGAVTIPAGGMAIEATFIRGGPTGITVNAGQTQVAAKLDAGSMYYQASTEPDSGDGTLGWTWTVSNTSGQIIVPVLPASAGATVNFFPRRLQVNP